MCNWKLIQFDESAKLSKGFVCHENRVKETLDFKPPHFQAFPPDENYKKWSQI